MFILRKSKNPVGIIVFGMVTGNDDIRPPFTFSYCLILAGLYATPYKQEN